MTLATLQAAVNTRLVDFWPKFRTKQTAYKVVNGRYWQGLVFSAVPDDGALVSPNYSLVAGSHAASWSAFVNGDLPATVEAQMFCDTYEAQDGIHGYFLTCRVSKSGVTYERVAQVENGALVTTGSWAQV
jgi:hypothetical protein